MSHRLPPRVTLCRALRLALARLLAQPRYAELGAADKASLLEAAGAEQRKVEAAARRAKTDTEASGGTR